MCAHMRLLLILLLVGYVRGDVYVCEKEVELPGLRMCDMTQEEFCQSLAPQSASVVQPTWCELTPLGMVVLMAGGAACPPGFVDDSGTHAERYLAVGAGGGTVGVADTPLATRTAPVAGLMSKAKDRGTDFNTDNVMMPTADSVTVRTAEVAPAVLFRLCRRDGACPP